MKKMAVILKMDNAGGANTSIGEYFYGYVDYRGASTAPDIYTYEVTEK